MAYKRLGEMLMDAGAITREQLEEALKQQKASGGKKLGAILLREGYITQEMLYSTLERQLGVSFIDLSSVTIDKELAGLVPRTLARRYSIVPVRLEEGSLYIATEDPLNFIAIEAVKSAVRRRVIPLMATGEAVARAITGLYDSETAQQALQELRRESKEDFQSIVSANIIGADTENAAPTIRLVNSFLEYGVNQNASDIHLEPREAEMAVRMRIDGELRKVFSIPRSIQNAVIARVKVMANMNIAEHRIPLDGRCNIRVDKTDVDLRISTLPTVFGEKVVIRLLVKDSGLLNTNGIGLTGANLDKFNALLENSNGMILIVGPTGSGKSSTMYTMIRRLNTEQVNLVTLEDPVEYNFDGVNQVQINEKTGMTFAGGLRSILRQDPDIVAVGEIRDGETAGIAMRAAITGHLVLSTVHTNDAPSTIGRLRDIGVEDYLIATALKGIVSQRLVRKICPGCKAAYEPTFEEQESIRMKPRSGRTFYKGKGCPICFHTGYKGRTAVFEILVFNSAIKRALADSLPHSELMRIIEESDYAPLSDDCIRLVEAGITTVSEAYRTVNTTDN